MKSIRTDPLTIMTSLSGSRKVLYEFIFDKDKSLKVKVNTKSKMIYASVSGNYTKGTVGLLGSPHKLGHFFRDGSKMLYEDINVFAESWQVKNTDPRLFQSIREPQFPSKCLYHKSEARTHGRSRRLKEMQLVTEEEANVVCSTHSPGPLRDFCIKDVLVRIRPFSQLARPLD